MADKDRQDREIVDPGQKPNRDPIEDVVDDEPKGPAFSSAILSRAESLGISDEDIESFGSEEALRAAINLMERAAPAKSGNQPASRDAAREGDGDVFDIGLDPDSNDPEVVAALRKLANHFGSQVGALQSEIERLHRSEESREEQTLMTEVDSYVRSERASMFGHDADGRRNTKRLMEEARVVQAGRRALGMTDLSARELLDRAFQSAFGDRIKESTRREIEQEAAEHRRRFIPRPTRTETPSAPTGQEAALLEIRKIRNRSS